MKRTCQTISIILASLYLSACATQTPIDTSNLSSLQNLNNTFVPSSSEASGKLRDESLKDTALTLGAQAGLAWRGDQINEELKQRAIYLRNTYNFYPLMLEHGVQPPVLEQGNNTLNINHPDVLRISDKTYKIIEQAKFVSTPPTWRNYLWMRYEQPEIPDKTLLPRDKAEQKTWEKYVEQGWYQGIKQADTIFAANMARLQRDYTGMLLYKKLLAHNMISKPYVAKTELGVTGDGETMNINDQVLRITATPQLQTDSKDWKPILIQ